MTADEERIDKALDSLSYARTALDDPAGLPVDEIEREPLEGIIDDRARLTEYAIDKIDDAMRLLSPEKTEPRYALMVAHNGAFVSRHFDAEDEAIDAIGEAIGRKMDFPDDVVTIVVGRVEP